MNRSRRETECHRLVREGKWQSLIDRLKTNEGKEEAGGRDFEQRLIFHLDNVFSAPLSVFRAMYDANREGWVSPLQQQRGDNGETFVTYYPIFLGIGRISEENLSFLLQKHPEAAEHKSGNNLPLHHACRKGSDFEVKLLHAVYPKGADMRDDKNIFPFVAGLHRLRVDTLLILLASNPSVVQQCVGSTRDLPLHIALQCHADKGIVEPIFNAFPHACKVRGHRKRLPLHCLCFFCESSKDAPLDVLKMILREYPAAAKTKDEMDQLPLHLLCQETTWDCSHKIDFFKELLNSFPEGAHDRDCDGYYPIDLLTGKDWESEHIKFVEEAFIQLIQTAPNTLLDHSAVKSGPLFEFVQSISPSAKMWKAILTCCPRALYAVDSDRGSALESEIAFGLEGPAHNYMPALLATFQSLRMTFGIWSRGGGVGDTIPVPHQFMYCGHLFLDMKTLPMPDKEFFDDVVDGSAPSTITSQDAEGNNPLHVACCAPCPPEKCSCLCAKSGSVIAALGKAYPSDAERRRSVSCRNIKGEIPLHRLLKNENACNVSFLSDIALLVESNNETSCVWDPTIKLLPFMICASFGEDREKTISISATYKLIHSFVASRDISCLATSQQKTKRSTSETTSSKRRRIKKE